MQILKKPLIISILILVLGIVSYFLFFNGSASAPSNKTSGTRQKDTVSENKTDTPPIPENVFDKATFSIDDPASKWVVVNKTRPLQPLSYAPDDLTDIGGGYKMRAEAAAQFTQMQADAKAAGLVISPLSSYRSYNTQVSTYNGWVQRLGQTQADRESARAGFSEHQTGLALDMGGGGCGIEPCFGDTAEGKWVDANAYKYGFLLRYRQEKMPITGYQSEPWHFRYIGVELASEMKTQNILTLEEFFGLPAAPDYL